jgi:hypothetical protein
VTVYDVSRSDDQLIHVNALPYALPAVLDCDDMHTGQILFPHLGDRGTTKIDLFRLCERGNIHRVTIPTSDDTGVAATGDGFEWSEDVKELSYQSAKLSPYVGTLEERDLVEENVHSLDKGSTSRFSIPVKC